MDHTLAEMSQFFTKTADIKTRLRVLSVIGVAQTRENMTTSRRSIVTSGRDATVVELRLGCRSGYAT